MNAGVNKQKVSWEADAALSELCLLELKDARRERSGLASDASCLLVPVRTLASWQRPLGVKGVASAGALPYCQLAAAAAMVVWSRCILGVHTEPWEFYSAVTCKDRRRCEWFSTESLDFYCSIDS